MSIYDRLNESSQEDWDREQRRLSKRESLLESFKGLIDQLPSDSDHLLSGFFTTFGRESEIRLMYLANDEEESKSIRSEIQKILHKPATRELDGYGDKVNWVFTSSIMESIDTNEYNVETSLWEKITKEVPVQTLKISINNGSLAPGCEIVTETHTYETKKIVCPEGTTEVVDQEFLGASS